MGTHRSRRMPPRGFTLVELLVVVLIVVLVGAATIKVAIFDQGGRKVSEAARMVQASIVGARDAAFRANAPRGIRLLPDPIFNGLNGGALAANRMISIGAAPDYNAGLASVSVAPANIVLPNGTMTSAVGFLTVTEASRHRRHVWGGRPSRSPTSRPPGTGTSARGTRSASATRAATTRSPGRPSSAPTTRRGRWAARRRRPCPPISTGTSTTVRRGCGIPPRGPPPEPGAPTRPTRCWAPPLGTSPSATDSHFAEFLLVVNGQDDDLDGWVDEGFDGIDNDGDGIIDPGFNGQDDDGDGIIDNPAELLWSYNAAKTQKSYFGGEYEPESFVGNEFNSLNISGSQTTDKPYTIVRRPVVTEGAREVMLPEGVVIDLTTWNGLSATPNGTLPERSRLPVDPYSFYVDVMIGPDGQVLTASAGQSAGAQSTGSTTNFPTSNMPFYHFWIAEREDVYDPMFGLTTSNVPQAQVPHSNPGNNGTLTPPVVNLLPMPQGTVGQWFAPSNGAITPQPYVPPQANGPYLKGDMRLVTLFVKSGQVITYDLGPSDFDPTDINQPYMQAQFGIKEAK